VPLLSVISCRLLSPPLAGQASSETCAPSNTAFGRHGDLAQRVIVLQAHWRINSNATAAEPAANLQLRLGAEPATAGTDGHYSAAAAAAQPALLGSFVGSGVYPPSSMSHSLQVSLQEAASALLSAPCVISIVDIGAVSYVNLVCAHCIFNVPCLLLRVLMSDESSSASLVWCLLSCRRFQCSRVSCKAFPQQT
jgi:hypothetical protein